MDQNTAAAGGAGAMGLVIMLVYLAILVLTIAGIWKVFVKAGEPGWAAIVPIYNLIVMLKVAGKPLWWFILFFVPLVGFIVFLLVAIAMAERFGKGVGFGIGLLLVPFVCYPVLGFGADEYRPAPAA